MTVFQKCPLTVIKRLYLWFGLKKKFVLYLTVASFSLKAAPSPPLTTLDETPAMLKAVLAHQRSAETEHLPFSEERNTKAVFLNTAVGFFSIGYCKFT